MNKRENVETVIQQKTNSFPIIALLLLNLLAILLTIGILLVRTKSLVNSSTKIPVDRIGEIKLDQGEVTFDLLTLHEATNQPRVTNQVCMKQQDFLTGFSQLEGLVKKMIADGKVKARGTATQPSP